MSIPPTWFELEEGAHRLAEYVRQVALARAYAGKINVVGYSLGGLLARWNVQLDVDGWGTLVNRPILVGVPNKSSVLAYTFRNVPRVLPFAYFAHAGCPHVDADVSVLAGCPDGAVVNAAGRG